LIDVETFNLLIFIKKTLKSYTIKKAFKYLNRLK